MSGVPEEEEDRPVSIAALRSRFESLATGNNGDVRPPSRQKAVMAGVPGTEGKIVGSKADGLGRGTTRDAAAVSEQTDTTLVMSNDSSANRSDNAEPTMSSVESLSVKARLKPPPVAPKPPSLASRPASPVVPQAGTTADSVRSINAVAGPSQLRASLRTPDVPSGRVGSSSKALDNRLAFPSLRRTSADEDIAIALPLSPAVETSRGSVASSLPSIPGTASSRATSPTPPSLSPNQPAISRAPSPKPPEPSRSTKPVRHPAADAATSTPKSTPLDFDIPPTEVIPVSAPDLPARKAAPITSATLPPPIPPNRPKLASVATAVMAAQALSGPPRLPTRNRAETVGTRDLPPPPSRSVLPVKSASVIPDLNPRKNRGINMSVPADDGMGHYDSPSEEYQAPPPPTRHVLPASPQPPLSRRPDPLTAEVALEADSEDEDDADGPNQTPAFTSAAKRAMEDYPDSTHANRRPPKFTPDVRITGTSHTTSFATHGRYVCTGSHVVRIYDTQLSDQPIHYIDLHHTGLEFRIKDPKVSAMCFRPAAFASEEGRYLWCGTKDGHLFELDIKTAEITDTRPALHSSSVLHIFRYKHIIMSLEEAGKLHVFTVGQREDGTEEIAKIPQLCRTVRITERFNFAKLIRGQLWTSSGPAHRSTTSTTAAKGPTIRVYEPCVPGATQGGKTVWATEWTGAVTCATVLPLDPNRVYLGHEGGYVSVWDADELVCRQVLKISSSDILSLEGVGERLWAGNRKGQIHAYDVSTKPWRATNLWTAHPEHSVHQLAVDPWSIEQTGRFVLWSMGKDALRAWDGLLSLDWIDRRMTARQADYSQFRNINTLVCSWNIDSAKPTELSGSEVNVNFLPDLLRTVDSPDIIVFGFQEVIPLTDKKLTAKTLLFGKSKDSGSTSDKVSQAYRLWLEKLSAAVRQAYPTTPYVKIHSESLVGLFTCVFVKASEKDYLRDVDVCTVKRGIGGIYGNKGAIIARLVIDDTSICFINVHLAAGQSAKAARTVDLGVIMEDKAILPVTDSLPFVNGGDGTAVLDHELVILNGDLNYRIDQRRENVLSSIQAGDLPYLLEHDQLRKEMQSNHAFRLRSFEEAPIHFKPTYKYNSGTSDYDSSEKRRIPAWCDRILFNKTPRLQSLHYRRYEPTVSDHKPISAAFRMQVKAIDPSLMEIVRKEVGVEWGKREGEILEQMERAYEEY